ncbi:SMP-30/gluconolactonase/LRE family protein [Streptomyces sp. NPDC006339]|uniref:SMP-30/gluconolactonase/LRE family protein n=1 Tax=Streptomyces sp. NPDC006339 TaxID=3156755 RepID=UPI0033B36E4F
MTRTEHDGTVTVLADRWQGKRLNSPNDAAVKSDGSIWFSDPDFGITSDDEGYRAESEIGSDNVFRIDPATGEVRLIADCFGAPNGLVFSPDERTSSSPTPERGSSGFSTYATGGRCPRARSSPRPGRTGRPVSTTCASTTAVGSGSPRYDGVHCYDPDGTLIGRLHVPETVANIAWGGAKRNRLFITAETSLYSVVMGVTGTHPTGPGRQPWR